MNLHSMWQATANYRTKHPMLTGDQHTEVVIIGAGYTGLSTAYHLQKENIDTIVLEKNRVGSGASGRNGGELLTGYLGSMKSWVDKLGKEKAHKLWDLSLQSIDLTESIIKENDIKCDFVRNGDFRPAYKHSHLDALKRDVEYMNDHFDFHELEIVEEQDLRTEMNSDFYYGGRINKKGAHYHPFNYALGLADAVKDAGGEIYENSEAIKVEHKNGNVIVHTDQGAIHAKKIVIATNAYSGDLNRKIQRSVVPVLSIMIATEPLGKDRAEDLIKNNRAMSDTKNLLYYFRRTGDHRLAFGGSGRAVGKRGRQKMFDELHQGMLDVYPQLRNTPIEYRWGGYVGFTRHMLPYIGRLKNGTYFAFGYGGHGAAMATMAGKLISDSIASGNEKVNPLTIDKLKPIPFHGQHAKAVGMMKFYMKFRDFIS